jgi:hypothetical protein
MTRPDEPGMVATNYSIHRLGVANHPGSCVFQNRRGAPGMSEGAIRFAVILICTTCATIVSNDAHRRGMNWPLWGSLIFLFSIVALPVYLIVRKPLLSSSKKPSYSSFDSGHSDLR